MLSFQAQEECLQLTLQIFIYLFFRSGNLSYFHTSTRDGGCLHCMGAVHICSTHANNLTHFIIKNKIQIPHGAIKLYLREGYQHFVLMVPQ